MRETPRVPTGDRAARKRLAIVRAARTAFVRDGFKVGMDTIAAEAGVSKVTVYNHFGNKDALFLAVVGDALEEALGAAIEGTAARLEETDDLRTALVWTAEAWVKGMIQPDVLALRHLVVNETHRFPELGLAWKQSGPDRARPALLDTFARLIADGRLDMPDVEVAIIQFYSLVLYPHLIHSAYGVALPRETTTALSETGVDMFLAYYKYRGPSA
ncbi:MULTISPECIES: TetR/AcrR family transcriptional regulator [Streptomyces]|uniref:TetR/AcrR family transcriptional regulator n=1 Tax=Streptomyces TaxID=1883 RepID=UPI0019228B4F|nr:MULTISPECIES: TetR/AcrR family transcriptional regulator [Streptomyces]MCM9079600.1 TetR/AcrR family transcriptional regulator [Streptomyces spororaveus]MCX5305986.1 TetR/AcrR family transcriptional regulator [Streptomyces sp. NBC_00160]